MKLSRFDRLFAKAQVGDLPQLKEKYPYLFPNQYSDSLWITKIKEDTLQHSLEDAVFESFPTFEQEKIKLVDFFRHLKYYFPEQAIPKVVTLISEVSYNNRVVLSDSLLLLGLDNYLGPEHEFYQGLPNFVAKRLDAQYLLSDVGSAFTNAIIPYPKDRSFYQEWFIMVKEFTPKSCYYLSRLLHNTWAITQRSFNGQLKTKRKYGSTL